MVINRFSLPCSFVLVVLLGCNVHSVICFFASPLLIAKKYYDASNHHHHPVVVDKRYSSSIPLCQERNKGSSSSSEEEGESSQESKNQFKSQSATTTTTTNEELLETLQGRLEYPSRIVIPGNNGNDDDVVSSKHRCGFVSIIGAPNMGKSTLLNALLEHPLCVATSRPQTTRHAILGVLSSAEQNCQLCFLDTPGVIKDPAYKLQEGMMEAVKGALTDADILLVVTDLFSTPIDDDSIFSRLRASEKPLVVIVNKVDLVDKINPEANMDETGQRTITVEDAIRKWRSLLPQAMAIIPLTASQGVHNVGVEALRRLLLGGPDVPQAFRNLGRPIPGMFEGDQKTIPDEQARQILPPGPPLYEVDALTDRNERFFASEIIRGSLFRKLGKELPYCCEVRINEFREPREKDPTPVVRIQATIFVERETQKGIVVGKGGKMIKDVGMDAREQLENFLQEKVYLNLNVKVDKDWRKDTKKLKSYGYLK